MSSTTSMFRPSSGTSVVVIVIITLACSLNTLSYFSLRYFSMDKMLDALDSERNANSLLELVALLRSGNA